MASAPDSFDAARTKVILSASPVHHATAVVVFDAEKVAHFVADYVPKRLVGTDSK
ncbi:MAG: hypothetical protein ACRD1I_02745 [Terriglobia bacterium]